MTDKLWNDFRESLEKMEIKLKPCPFCGSKAELLIVPDKMTKWAARCTKCCANNGTFVSDHDAVEAWNKRTEPEKKHGKWVYDEHADMFHCSECREGAVSNVYNYCMWCGAKMDERGEKINDT